MGKRLWGVILFLLAAALGAEAQYYAVNGACSLGGQATVMQGMASSGTRPLRGGTTFNGSGVMASYPGCTVTVYQTGTNVPALIYSTAIGGSRSNPFTGDLNDGSWVFFAAAGCYDITISSGATQASTMPTPKSFPGVCAGAGGSGSGGGTAGTTVTVNGVAAVPNQLNFTNTLLVPSGSTVVNFLLNGNTVGAYVTGTGGGGGTLPTTPQYDLFASTGSGGAQTSGILGGSGFLKGQVFLATGDVTSSPAPFPIAPNGSVEYFPSGASFGGINIGATNGLAAYFSHSGRSGAAPGYGNGGLALGGGNNSGTNYQVYLDCESAPALNCDFKVPITVNGSAVGGGGGGSLPGALREVLASNGVGGAQATGTYANNTFFRAGVLESTGAGTLTSPFSNPNGSIEYFPTGGYGIGGANGVALHFSHSAISNGTSPGWGNGGVALAGGNASGVNYQIYLDCESAPLGCDFKVPVTINGAAIGGGGGGAAWGQITGTLSNQADLQSALNGKLSTTGTAASATALAGTPTLCTSGQAAAGILANGNATGCVAVGGGAGSGTVSSGTAGHFTWYAAAGTTVTSNANLDDSVSTAATITSQETLAAPGINVTGSGGIAMTGAGGTLPTPAANSGGIGIGPGNVPQFYSNGGAWANIGGGGATLPTTAQYDLFASTGAGAAQASGVLATGGFIKSGASIVSGTAASSPFTGANASQEFYNSGGTITPSTGPPITFTNGAALFMGHGASTAGASGDAGIALGGGSATPTSRVYLDCEVAGCDFKVPLTVNGSAIGGTSSLSSLTAATTAHTIASANFPQRWNWAQTVDSQSGMTLGEDVTTPVPSTGGTVAAGGIANQKAVSIETAAGSTAVPLNITQGSVTGATATTNPPALQVQTTWNNGAAGPQNRALVVNVTSTASSLAALMADFQLGGSSVFQVTKNGDIGLASNRYLGPISNTNNMTICGGGVAGTITAVASICATSTGSAAGGVIIRGGDNSSTGAAAVGGIALLRGGLLNQSSGFPAGVEGTAQVVEGYAASATGITAGMVVCMTTAAYQIAACPTNAQNVVGIAGTPVIATAGGAVPVVSYGTMVITLDNTATIGDVVCMSTTAAGQGHDNALTACTSPNLTLGVVIATAGTFLSASGQSTASSTLSTTLPAVQLRIGH